MLFSKPTPQSSYFNRFLDWHNLYYNKRAGVSAAADLACVKMWQAKLPQRRALSYMLGLRVHRREANKKMEGNSNKRIVACLGASATAAIGSYDWIGDVARRPQNIDLRFVRFAEGGDLAYNGLARLPKIINLHPSYILILLGDNDVLSSVFENHYRFMRSWKRLPQKPTIAWFQECIGSIVQRLKSSSEATIALISPIPIGENLNSLDPFQSSLNQKIKEYSAALKEIAADEKVGYIPFSECMGEMIAEHPGQAFTSFRFLPFYRDVFRQFVLRKSHDEIGRMNGWNFHRDGIHLNSISGKMLADLVSEFIEETLQPQKVHPIFETQST